MFEIVRGTARADQDMTETVKIYLMPEDIDREAAVEKDHWLRHCHTNEEIHQTLWKLDAEHARRIYDCCRMEPGHLDYYVKSDGEVSRMFPAVLGAFAGRCALCGWDAKRHNEIRKALKSSNGPMFPMPEMEAWVKAVEEKVRSCEAGHSGLEIWRLMRMLRVKVVEPKAAKLETEFYE
jgi:hypothetical protein